MVDACPRGSHSVENRTRLWSGWTPLWKRQIQNASFGCRAGCAQVPSAAGSFYPDLVAPWWAKRRGWQLLVGGGNELAGKFFMAPVSARRWPLDSSRPLARSDPPVCKALTDLPMAATTRLPSRRARTPVTAGEKLWAHISNDSFSKQRAGQKRSRSMTGSKGPPAYFSEKPRLELSDWCRARHQEAAQIDALQLGSPRTGLTWHAEEHQRAREDAI